MMICYLCSLLTKLPQCRDLLLSTQLQRQFNWSQNGALGSLVTPVLAANRKMMSGRTFPCPIISCQINVIRTEQQSQIISRKWLQVHFHSSFRVRVCTNGRLGNSKCSCSTFQMFKMCFNSRFFNFSRLVVSIVNEQICYSCMLTCWLNYHKRLHE